MKRQRNPKSPDKPAGKSKYAMKVTAGRQMYGNGRQCCGHRYMKRAGGRP